MEKALAFAHLWDRLYPGVPAECWDLDRLDAYHALLRDKPALRRLLPGRAFCLRLPGRSIVASLHPFHVPDPGDLARDTALLSHLAGHGA